MKLGLAAPILCFILVACLAPKREQKVDSGNTVTPAISQSASNNVINVSEQVITSPVKSNNCPNDMIEVTGDYCSNLEEVCLTYGDPDNKGANGPVQCLNILCQTLRANYLQL